MSFEDCQEYVVVQYKSKLFKGFRTYTFSPKPSEEINEAAWQELMKDEFQNGVDREALLSHSFYSLKYLKKLYLPLIYQIDMMHGAIECMRCLKITTLNMRNIS